MNYIFTNKDDLTKIIYFFSQISKNSQKKNILIIFRTLNSFDIKYIEKQTRITISEACSENNCLFIYIFHFKKKSLCVEIICCNEKILIYIRNDVRMTR